MLVGTAIGGQGAGGVGGGAEVSFIARNAYNSAVTPIDVTTTWQTTAAGSDNSDGQASRTWLLSGAAADYELFVSVTSGSLSSGTAGAWITMNATNTYTRTRTNNIAGETVVEIACQCRRASDLVVIATWNVSITAEVLP